MNRLLSASALMTLALATTVSAGTQPYAGQDTRPIAALSEQDIDDLLNGRGWGFAKPAELNGYPGPAHVLELADDLKLSDDQRARVQAVFVGMQAEAQVLGGDYVQAERTLNDLFGQGEATAEQLIAQTASIAEIRGRLRAVHLAAHLEMPQILNRHQMMQYNQLRGYTGEQDHSGDGGHSHD